jgi:hypothetical protein
MKFINRVPSPEIYKNHIEAGEVLCHDLGGRPEGVTQEDYEAGTFEVNISSWRLWWESKDRLPKSLEICTCGFAKKLGTHYRRFGPVFGAE